MLKPPIEEELVSLVYVLTLASAEHWRRRCGRCAG